MPEILLAALNARYTHPSLGLRSLRANLGALREGSSLVEFDLSRPPGAVAEALLRADPRVLAFGVYVWNASPLAAVLEEVRRRSPQTRIVLGGPELAAEGIPEWATRADLLVCGEAEGVFEEACRGLLAGRRPGGAVLHAPPPDLDGVLLPDGEYSEEDLRHRVTYVESSRGCPFGCEYCLSSRDRAVRTFPDFRVAESLDRLLRRGARRFKFVDRTFNLEPGRAAAHLSFWLERVRPGLSVQFEAVPERFPPEIRDLLRRFPRGALRLEIGVQTLDPEVSGRVGRRVDPARVEETFRFLREETRVDVHADLIAGLPGESLAGFARSFNRLAGWRPAEIQVGLLKRLRGAPIARHDAEFGMRYSADPPYELIASAHLDEDQVRRLKRFARYWDRMVNRGALREAVPLLWREAGEPFETFLAFSDWLFERMGRDWGLPLDRLARALADYLGEVRGLPRAAARVEEIWTKRAPRLKLPAR